MHVLGGRAHACVVVGSASKAITAALAPQAQRIDGSGMGPRKEATGSAPNRPQRHATRPALEVARQAAAAAAAAQGAQGGPLGGTGRCRHCRNGCSVELLVAGPPGTPAVQASSERAQALRFGIHCFV